MSKLIPKVGETWKVTYNRKVLIVDTDPSFDNSKENAGYYGITLSTSGYPEDGFIFNSYYCHDEFLKRIEEDDGLLNKIKERLGGE